jgi:folate-dependent phosphoribosylglycinamide formyltransferase PurN
MYELGWFTTARDKAAIDLFECVQEKIDSGELRARIKFVFCNRAPREAKVTDAFFDIVRKRDISLVYKSSKDYERELWQSARERWRERYDGEVARMLRRFATDLDVLAGYMLILSPVFCEKRFMINLHPALPGAQTGTWQEVVWQLIREKRTESGVTVHRVEKELDRGLVITYCRYSISGKGFDAYRARGDWDALFRAIREAGVRRELPLLLTTIKWFAHGKLRVKDGKVYVDGKECVGGCDLSQVVEGLLR